MVNKETQGLGILEGMKFNNKSDEPSKKNKEKKTKEKKARSYILSTETIKQIDILKIFVYPDYTREQIVEEAIQELYKKKYKKIELQNELED